jgi:hypothetical protein
MCVFASLQKIIDLRAVVVTAIRSYGSIPVRKLASVVGKLVLLEVAFGPAILVGTRIVSIQVSKVSDQFGWERGFVVLSDDSRVALKRFTASLDLWNGHPMRTPESDCLDLGFGFRGPFGYCEKGSK